MLVIFYCFDIQTRENKRLTEFSSCVNFSRSFGVVKNLIISIISIIHIHLILCELVEMLRIEWSMQKYVFL